MCSRKETFGSSKEEKVYMRNSWVLIHTQKKREGRIYFRHCVGKSFKKSQSRILCRTFRVNVAFHMNRFWFLLGIMLASSLSTLHETCYYYSCTCFGCFSPDFGAITLVVPQLQCHCAWITESAEEERKKGYLLTRVLSLLAEIEKNISLCTRTARKQIYCSQSCHHAKLMPNKSIEHEYLR